MGAEPPGGPREETPGRLKEKDAFVRANCKVANLEYRAKQDLDEIRKRVAELEKNKCSCKHGGGPALGRPEKF